MKKILASIVALTAITGFATVAHADTSTHGGNVPVQCTVVSTDGTLAETANSNVIDSSASPGTITTKCNTTTSKLTSELTAFTEPALNPNPAANAYTVGFKLNGGVRAYGAGANAGIPTVAYNTYTTGLNSTITVNGIGFGLLDQSSTVNVVARGRVNPNAQVAAGDYTITVTNTVAP